MKTVLVIGGSRFTGRVFSIFASKNGGFDLHVVNRGNYPMNLERVAQYKCDRRDAGMLPQIVPDLPGRRYDALVDFCAYEPGEVQSVVDALGGRIKQYIFFSTASICAPCSGFADESAPVAQFPENVSDPVTEYLRKKAVLERELAEACAKAGISYTILRPTFIYGPFNYAPRESYFIELIAKGRAVPFPTDSTSRFNFVYVLDVAAALMACIGDERAYGEMFNLAGLEAVTYSLLMSELVRCNGGAFDVREVTSAQADEELIPLPFPLAGDALASGEKFARAFDFRYTPFSVGMDKTFRIFRDVFAT